MARLLQFAVSLAMAGTLLGQAKPAKNDDHEKPQAQQEQVAPDDMVIVITGACKTEPLQFAVRDCVRGVTRQEFEEMLALAAPNATPQLKQQLADRMARIIILSNQAKKLDLPKDPAVKEYLKFIDMQVMADLLLTKTLKEQAAKQVTDEAIASYYAEHQRELETAEFLRIAVPKKAGEAGETASQVAEALRTRCAAGEDPNKLQAEADQRGEQKEAPAADLKNQRAAGYPEAQRTMFSLKPGECAVVGPDPNQIFVYKMVAVTLMPMEEARKSISATLESEYIKKQLEELTKQNIASFNNKYFPSANTPQAPQTAPGANPK